MWINDVLEIIVKDIVDIYDGQVLGELSNIWSVWVERKIVI